nr:S24 family peptidase [uncultured Capnocytophaga sp.]
MNVKERIKRFIESEHISISAFEKAIDVSNGYINSISKNIGVEKLNVILEKYPKLNIEWLITGKGEMLKGEQTFSRNIKNLMPKVVVVDDRENDRIPLVPVRAQAGYLSSYDDVEFIETLPTYSLPNMTNGTFRIFQVSGLSMYPTLQDGSYVVGRFVDNWEHLSSNRVCVVVTQNDGIIVKRVTNTIAKYGTLYCKSDNRDYPHISVRVEEVREIWECKMHLSFEFLDPVTNYQKIASLEADVAHLKELLGVNFLGKR